MIRFKKILCPVDFFKTSSRAFDYALKLATHYKAKVHAIHAVAPIVVASYDIPFSATSMTMDLKGESERFLNDLKKNAAGKGVAVTTQVAVGDVDRQILRAAAKEKADLIVIGTHGRRGFERLMLGSVTERIVRSSAVPILTVGLEKRGATPPPNIRRILLTTDFSAGTPEAMKYALSLAKECGATLTLLHVIHDITADTAGTYRDLLVRGVKAELQRLIPEQALDWCTVENRIEIGLPHRKIPKVIQKGKFDLVVMNIHGKSLLERAMLGSTAERTLRAAAGVCPVLLIPPKTK